MITADELSLIPRQLKNDRSLKSEILAIFQEIVNTSRYQDWLRNEQFTGNLFRLDDEERNNPLLNQFNLVKDGRLQVKAHSFRGAIFLTDGLWIPNQHRVYPFYDESHQLLQHTEKNKLHQLASSLIDPSCGCGHHALATSKIQQNYAFDISYRAIIYTAINALINSTERIFIKQNDIQDGIPEELSIAIGKRVLFLINMPFAIAPLPNILPLATDGGVTGAKWTFKALEALKNFVLNNPDKDSIHASILCYTVGDRQHSKWEVVEKANQMFGESKVSWTLLKDEKLWRVNGKKEQLNPMNLAEGLPKKADCQLYVKDRDREELRTQYKNLVKSLNNAGWEYLGYGIVDIQV